MSTVESMAKAFWPSTPGLQSRGFWMQTTDPLIAHLSVLVNFIRSAPLRHTGCSIRSTPLRHNGCGVRSAPYIVRGEYKASTLLNTDDPFRRETVTVPRSGWGCSRACVRRCRRPSRGALLLSPPAGPPSSPAAAPPLGTAAPAQAAARAHF
eukprot:260330-Prorocentrum_minimum.AAC.2